MRLPTDSRNDQAEGLRQMFAHAQVTFVPVVANPFVAFAGVLLERLCSAFVARGASVLVVDAADSARAAGEMALVELTQCVEPLAPGVAYLAARGLPIRFVDARGSTQGFLRALADASPRSTVVLVHAGAPDLCRLFPAGPAGTEAARAILFADDRPSSVTHAYAAMKLLVQRAGLVVFDLMLGAAPHSPRAERIAARLAGCADDFLGVVLRDWARIDPAEGALEPPGADLARIVADRLAGGAARIRPPAAAAAREAVTP